MKVLVTYYSESGSTQDIAREIAANLKGHEVDVQEVTRVQSLKAYDHVIIGTPNFMPGAARTSPLTLLYRPGGAGVKTKVGKQVSLSGRLHREPRMRNSGFIAVLISPRECFWCVAPTTIRT